MTKNLKRGLNDKDLKGLKVKDVKRGLNDKDLKRELNDKI